MIILGVTHPVSHNTAACLLVDGMLAGFAEEERFSRLKHAPNAWPERAIEFCLRRAGLRAADITTTAVGFAQPDRKRISAVIAEHSGIGLDKQNDFDLYSGITHLAGDLRIIPHGQLQYVDHHLAHAASAVIASGFSAANIISLDGWGGASSGILGTWRNGSIQVLRQISPRQSWGIFFELITAKLGFRPHSGEGKTMGLAPYGEVDQQLLPDWCEPELGLPDLDRYRSYLADALRYPEASSSELNETRKNLAATLQYYYERSLIKIALWLNQRSGIRHFALAGGVALNCTANGRLAQEPIVDEIFIQPASHDAGTALGAAILAHHSATGSWPLLATPQPFAHPYWGEGYSNDAIRRCLDFTGVRYRECDPALAAAEALAADRLVGFFQGRAEVGPRALGNRSILAHPGKRANLDRVNLRVKRRESWRPLAPSALTEKFFDVFDLKHRSPFMLLACQVHGAWREKLPAVVHVDNSARPQSVDAGTNPLYHRMISEFERRCGLPAVLNTSFNLDDEPIVNSPENAVATFFRSGLETLVIGEFVIDKGA